MNQGLYMHTARPSRFLDTLSFVSRFQAVPNLYISRNAYVAPGPSIFCVFQTNYNPAKPVQTFHVCSDLPILSTHTCPGMPWSSRPCHRMCIPDQPQSAKPVETFHVCFFLLLFYTFLLHLQECLEAPGPVTACAFQTNPNRLNLLRRFRSFVSFTVYSPSNFSRYAYQKLLCSHTWHFHWQSVPSLRLQTQPYYTGSPYPNT